MRALSESICFAEKLFSSLQLSPKSLNDENAISFKLVLKQSLSSDVS